MIAHGENRRQVNLSVGKILPSETSREEQNQYLDHEGIPIILINDNNIINKSVWLLEQNQFRLGYY